MVFVSVTLKVTPTNKEPRTFVNPTLRQRYVGISYGRTYAKRAWPEFPPLVGVDGDDHLDHFQVTIRSCLRLWTRPIKEIEPPFSVPSKTRVSGLIHRLRRAGIIEFREWYGSAPRSSSQGSRPEGDSVTKSFRNQSALP